MRKPWQQNDYGIDFSAARRWVTNSWWRVKGEAIEESGLMGAPAAWGSIDCMSVDTSTLRGGAEWTVERAATMHGYYVWFDTELGGGPGISNTPLLPSIAYGRAFFPLESEVAVEPGDHVQVKLAVLAMEEDHLYNWDTVITAADGSRKARFRQSTFNAKPIAQRARRVRRTCGHAVGIRVDRPVHPARHGRIAPTGCHRRSLDGAVPREVPDQACCAEPGGARVRSVQSRGAPRGAVDRIPGGSEPRVTAPARDAVPQTPREDANPPRAVCAITHTQVGQVGEQQLA